MSKVRVHITVSADGYVARPNQSLENPLGEGGLHAVVLHRHASGGTRCRRPDDSISLASRRARVSGRFALTTQNVAIARYDGDCALNQSQADGLSRNAASWSASNAAS